MTKKKKLQIRNSTAEFLIFTNQAKEGGIEVRVQDETIWLSQKLMGTLFDCSTDNISLHLKNIFKENELNENTVTEEFSVTASWLWCKYQTSDSFSPMGDVFKRFFSR